MADKYKSLDELKSHNVKGVDYGEIIKDNNSLITVMSIHGGLVELGTSEIAKEIAKDDFNYYDFSALRRRKKQDFHVTSHNFYQEDLEKMLKRSDAAISIHGCTTKGKIKPVVCIGGLDEKLKSIIREKLAAAGFKLDLKRFPAGYRRNVVNRAKNYGVQLEITYALRKTFFENIKSGNRKPNENFYCFTNAVRSAIVEYLKSE